ncbi:hypothetical protein MASR2M47_08230 [Draconibacterium sp.]|jgi:hypothetical protein
MPKFLFIFLKLIGRYSFIFENHTLDLLENQNNNFKLSTMDQQQLPQTPPPNYLVFAILTTLFCCQILGIVSIVFAAQVNSRWNSGDIQGALDASKNAKLWAWIALGSGVIIAIGVTILAALGVLAGFFGGANF